LGFGAFHGPSYADGATLEMPEPVPDPVLWIGSALNQGRRNRGGIVGIVLGVMIWQQLPSSALSVLGLLLGINLVFSGITFLMLAMSGPAFWKDSFEKRRCLVPASAFCEPDEGKPARWHWFALKGEEERPLFAFPGQCRRPLTSRTLDNLCSLIFHGAEEMQSCPSDHTSDARANSSAT
jgi:hypothetical protein